MIDCSCTIKETKPRCKIFDLVSSKTKEKEISCKIKDVMLYNVLKTYQYGYDDVNYGYVDWERKEC